MSEKKDKVEIERIHIELTSNCNLNCLHCCFHTDENTKKCDEKIEFSVLKECLYEAEKLGIKNIKFTGGEPFTYYKIEELIDFLNKRNFNIIFMSNGIIINRYIKKLNKENVSFVISLDGFITSHDYLRGKGTFEATMKNVKILLKEKFTVKINMCVYDKNISEIDSFKNYLKSLGIISVNIQPIRPVGIAKNKLKDLTNFLEDSAKIRELYHDCLNWEKEKISKNMMFCNLCKSEIMIDYKGRVFDCTYINELEKGNINNDSLIKIINKKGNIEIISSFERDMECNDCELFKIKCAGGCRMSVKKISGNYTTCDYWIPFLLDHDKYNCGNKKYYELLSI